MKFAVEQGLSGGDFYFVADCHDSAPCPAADDPAWVALRTRNREIKQAIEAAWHAAGLPTLAVLARAASDSARGLRPRGRRILLVDDEPANLELCGAILRTDGFAIASSTNGADAIEQAAATRPDLVVSDYEMPGLTGRDVARQIKAMNETRSVPVLICTYADLSLGELRPADAVLRRPFSVEALKDAVTRLVPCEDA
jgi:CheY-like chemotaxis protein